MPENCEALQLGDFDLYRKTVTVLGKGAQAPADPDLGRARQHTVDEYMLTEYPLLGRTPVAADFLWYAVYRRRRSG